MKTQTAFIGLVLCFLINVRECRRLLQRKIELIAYIFPFQQITCIIENFEFEYDDIGNDIDATGKEYASRMHFPSMKAEKSMQNFYYKYPVSPRRMVATADNIQPTFQASNNQNSAHSKLAFHFVNPLDSSAKSTAQTAHRTINVAQLTDQKLAQTKQAAKLDDPNAARSFMRPQEDFPYHQQAIILNRSSMPINQQKAIANSNSYYSPLTPQQKYMIRPIYVRLVKPFQGNFLADQMALNRQTEIPHTHHVTFE